GEQQHHRPAGPGGAVRGDVAGLRPDRGAGDVVPVPVEQLRRQRRLLRHGGRPAGRHRPGHPEAGGARRQHRPAAHVGPGLGPPGGQHRRRGLRRRLRPGQGVGRGRLPDRAAGVQRGRRDAVVRAGPQPLRVAADPGRRQGGRRLRDPRPGHREGGQRRRVQHHADPRPAGPAVRRRPAPGRLGRLPHRRPQEGARRGVHAVPAGGRRPGRGRLDPRRHPGVRAGRLPGPGRLRRLPPGPVHRGGPAGLGQAGLRAAGRQADLGVGVAAQPQRVRQRRGVPGRDGRHRGGPAGPARGGLLLRVHRGRGGRPGHRGWPRRLPGARPGLHRVPELAEGL
ncbi:MAG: hypothetical protein AVDCRST_MAG41-54, partial [uncultured Corynebacteriales bacterium]